MTSAMLGLFHPTSPQPKSSARMNTMFGRPSAADPQQTTSIRMNVGSCCILVFFTLLLAGSSGILVGGAPPFDLELSRRSFSLCHLKLPALEDTSPHCWFHLFDFSPLCVEQCGRSLQLLWPAFLQTVPGYLIDCYLFECSPLCCFDLSPVC